MIAFNLDKKSHTLDLKKYKFSTRLLSWYDQHGRHKLPWKTNKTLYRVWVSEVMLQQTQVATVIPYYQRFMQRFTSIQALASASEDEVLALWSGLGYYARGRNLRSAAQQIVQKHAGQFPEQYADVNALAGIGPSTAGAILALTLNQRHVILDGNVKRSLSRYCGIEGYAGEKKIETQLWALADAYTPTLRVADYTQAIMDMGALLCTRSMPNCAACPHSNDCVALQTNCIDSLPTPKPKKIKPHKHCYMLVMINPQNEVMLYKRPSKGIWGGLYSFPELTKQQTQSLQNQFTVQFGQDIKHVFTHFTLTISPIYLQTSPAEIKRITQQIKEFDTLGVLLTEPSTLAINLGTGLANIGLPAPITKLLKQAKNRSIACY